MKLISFVVVACNNPRSLRTCLSSLVDQTVPPEFVEIIVVDNTVDPDTAAENRVACIDPRIRYENTAHKTYIDKPGIRHSRCLYTATEIGIGMASGEFVVMPNQDSYYAPVFAERMLALAKEENLELVYCDLVLGGPGHGYFMLNTAPHNCACDKTCLMFKREWFQGFPDKHTNYELADGLFVESLVARGIRHGRMAQPLLMHN